LADTITERLTELEQDSWIQQAKNAEKYCTEELKRLAKEEEEDFKPSTPRPAFCR
jgi:hypothetical protein